MGKLGDPFWGTYDWECSLLGPRSGSPYLWKLPHGRLSKYTSYSWVPSITWPYCLRFPKMDNDLDNLPYDSLIRGPH